jgi:glycolate oxidase iron-sulfur subunit
VRAAGRTGAAPADGGRGIFTPELLDRCISCGFCLPACPTYVRTGVETSSPRGRIDLMRALESGELPDDDPTVQEESSFCLGCRACEPVCPAGVQYGALLEEWRDHTWHAGRARGSLRRRALLAPLLWAADRPWRLRIMGLVRRPARRRAGREGADGTGGHQLMLGCFERALFPKVSRAAVELLPDLQVDPRQGCCGALHAHNGDLDRGRELAEELGRRLPGTIVTTSGGCAAHLASVLGAERVRELSQHLTQDGAPEAAPAPAAPLRIALQDSCHLRNGLGVWQEPRALLAAHGQYVELPSASECCGAAGSYSLLRPGDAGRVLDDKLDEIEAAGVDVVVAVNPGCLRQLQTGLKRRGSRVRAVHLAELLAAADDR